MIKRKFSLATSLVIIMLVLMTVALAGVGTVVVVLMQRDLLGALDTNVAQVADRSVRFATDTETRATEIRGNRGRNPLNAPGTPTGALTVKVLNDSVSYASFLNPDGQEEQLGNSDLELLRKAGALTSSGVGKRAKDGDFYTVDLSIGTYRLDSVSLIRKADQSKMVVITGLPTDSLDDSISRLIIVTLIVSIGTLVVAGSMGWLLIRASLRPLERVAKVATNVAAMPLAKSDVELTHERVPTELATPGSEAGDVGYALNLLLDNVESAFTARNESESKLRTFIADASHELRTPLTAIRGYAEMIKVTEDLSEDGQKSLDRVESQSVRMTALVEDLMLLARLDAGRSVDFHQVELNELVVETILDANAVGPDHEWHCDVPLEPICVLGDRAQLTQVLVNLLGNARKHTPVGTSVTASLRRCDGTGYTAFGIPNGNWAELRVLDNGPGIKQEFLPKLFDRFSRADPSRKAAGEGSTGLGLAITKAIIDGCGGRILVQSSTADEGHHTVFTILIPSVEASQEPAGTADPAVQLAARKPDERAHS